MRHANLNVFQVGFLAIMLPIVLIAFVIGWWNHDYNKGWSFYMSGVRFITAPLFHSLEVALQVPAPHK